MNRQSSNWIDYFNAPHKHPEMSQLIFPNLIWDMVPLVDCMRCGNPLLAKEIKAKQHHCEPCKRLVEAAAHQEKVSNDIHRANIRGGL